MNICYCYYYNIGSSVNLEVLTTIYLYLNNLFYFSRLLIEYKQAFNVIF